MIRVGIGGWTYEPWRGAFYPKGLPQRSELEYASQHLTTIEINATYYGSQKPASFARWRETTPPGFVFSVKGPRFATNRRTLAEAGGSIERFFASGVLELGEKLGPVNWQFLPTKQFDPADFEAFLALLPGTAQGRPLRHVVELRHESFRVPECVALLRKYGVATVLADKPRWPSIPDITASFVYVRLQCASEAEETGYRGAELDQWAARTKTWAQGGAPDAPATIAKPLARQGRARDVFVYMINGFKPKAPSAALALIARLAS